MVPMNEMGTMAENAKASDSAKQGQPENGSRPDPIRDVLDAMRPKPPNVEHVAVHALIALSDLRADLDRAYAKRPLGDDEDDAWVELSQSLATARKKAKYLISAQK